MTKQDPALNGREERFVRSVRRIGPARIVSFLRAVRGTGCTAVQLINEELDDGKTLESVFVTGDQFGYSLSVKRLDEGAFLISFGCQAGPLAGDGGEWEVRFDENGAVMSTEPGTFWVS